MTMGGCLCGAVRFEVKSFSSGVFKCHCSKCRKSFGGASSAVALAPESAFQWLQGQDSIALFRQGPTYGRCFCPACGCILPQHLPDYGAYWVPAGLLDSDPGLALERHVHVASKAPWEVLDGDTEQLPEGF